MKAKRIVSILLTGSMLLSLLPVSALAAAPVFDAPAQTTAKKAAPLVQEADASRSTEEEAATRSSRDLDAENGTAESITTIQLNAAGEPASEGDFGNWYYSADSGCQLDTGVFALQPSSEPEAESALKARLFHIGDNAELVRGTVGCETNNYGTIFDGIFQGKVANFRTISNGTFQREVNNYRTISGGTFQGKVENHGAISDGAFQGTVENYQTISGGTFQERVGNWAGGTISGGTFQGDVDNNSGGTISGGTFQGTVQNDQTISGGIFQEFVSNYQTISGGTFQGAVTNYETISGGTFQGTVENQGTISGGYFVTKPTMPEGSGTGFAAVSDQSYRAFKVPVNGDWSEKGYSSLYVPRGSSEQPNTITVKTNTKLLYYLADGEQFPAPDSDSDSYVYQIPVQSFEKIVLVTEEPSAPPTDDPGGELDPDFSSGTAALGVVLATAGFGSIAYIYGTSVYLYYAMPDGFIPSTRQELATVLWTAAGKPDPVSTALYTDIPADAIEQQKAARWCVEQGLMSDHGATFGPDTKVTNARIIRAWNRLKKVPVTITN